MRVRINQGLDKTIANRAFSKNGKVRLKNFLNRNDAGSLFHALSDEVQYKMAFVHKKEYQVLDEKAWLQLSDNVKRDITQDILKDASDGLGFIYGRHAVLANDDNLLLNSFHKLMNSLEILDCVRNMTGCDSIRKANIQAARFTAGQFLTRHQDIVKNEVRKIAFVLNLSPKWHPDWGGLLQFFEPDGATTESWSPEFNTLNLFDVKHIHSVTYVTPFAKHPRYSLSGWFTT